MPFSLDKYFEGTGTKFLLHAQAPVLSDFKEPEVVWVSSPTGTVDAGPADARMYVVVPKEKQPYDQKDTPPFRGESHPPAMPGPWGHFDHLRTGTPEFVAAHMFGSVRRVMDIWEVYAGGPLPWHFQMHHPRLEMISHLPWKNAQFGWGFCECGEDIDDDGMPQPFALNFDVIAHEVGHGVVYSMTGIPSQEDLTADYLGFHESASDLVAILSAVHFESFIKYLLEKCEGDLYLANEMNRIGELSGTRQIRSASNAIKLSDLGYRDKAAMDLSGHEVHELGQPLTGAFFDILIEFFMRRLVKFGLIDEKHAQTLRRVELGEALSHEDGECTAQAYRKNPERFADALRDARDMLGIRLAKTWHELRPSSLRFSTVARQFMEVDYRMTGRRHTRLIKGCFDWRGIGTDD